jgi:type IV pilus assembly protein PilW
MDTIEADLRMASNWGMLSRGNAVEGRSLQGTPNPLGLPAPAACGATWALDLGRPIAGSNNNYVMPCAANGVGGAQNNSDVVTSRRAAVVPSPLTAGRLQVQSSRIQGEMFANGVRPAGFTPVDSETHDLLVNTYYVAANSDLIPGVPTLRRKTLVPGPAIVDQEVAPGVENMQLQFGVDMDQDNTVDRYVNPGDPIITPGNPAFVPTSRVMTARVWLVVRGLGLEVGVQDNTNYQPGDVNLGNFNDEIRRIQVSKTILLRNARS